MLTSALIDSDVFPYKLKKILHEKRLAHTLDYFSYINKQ